MGGGFTSQSIPPQQPYSPEEEIKALKEQSQALSKQMAEIQQRIEELKNK
jgi:uncharacterized coiled-coil DUF342 family protein